MDFFNRFICVTNYTTFRSEKYFRFHVKITLKRKRNLKRNFTLFLAYLLTNFIIFYYFKKGPQDYMEYINILRMKMVF